MQPEIFKAYDIRGTYPDMLDVDAALAIARAFARFLGRGPVVLGRDMRASGGLLREAFVRGLRSEGADVIDVGRVATPMLYFATRHTQSAGGVMITASHNPGAYNGFKLCARAAVPVGIESGLAEIRELALQLEGVAVDPERGSLCFQRIDEAYQESLLQLFPARPRLRVVIDAGNGIAGEAMDGLLARLALNVTRLYFEPDGTFPNHEADPLKSENLEDLRAAVRREHADLGMALDGDGDRAVFVDEQGEAIPADLMTALLAGAVLDQGLLGAEPGARVVYDLRSSHVVPETVREHEGVPLRSRVGHAFMKQKMRQEQACFGGELSGHYYFHFPSGYVADDGAAAMLLLLQVLDSGPEPLSLRWQPFRRYFQSGEINRRVTSVRETLRRIEAHYSSGRPDHLDGLTVEWDDWWFNLRPSNTEPLLRLNLEAARREDAARHRDELLALIEA